MAKRILAPLDGSTTRFAVPIVDAHMDILTDTMSADVVSVHTETDVSDRAPPARGQDRRGARLCTPIPGSSGDYQLRRLLRALGGALDGA